MRKLKQIIIVLIIGIGNHVLPTLTRIKRVYDLDSVINHVKDIKTATNVSKEPLFDEIIMGIRCNQGDVIGQYYIQGLRHSLRSKVYGSDSPYFETDDSVFQAINNNTSKQRMIDSITPVEILNMVQKIRAMYIRERLEDMISDFSSRQYNHSDIKIAHIIHNLSQIFVLLNLDKDPEFKILSNKLTENLEGIMFHMYEIVQEDYERSTGLLLPRKLDLARSILLKIKEHADDIELQNTLQGMYSTLMVEIHKIHNQKKTRSLV